LKIHHRSVLVGCLASGITLIFSGCEGGGGGGDATYNTEREHSAYEAAYYTNYTSTGTSSTDTATDTATNTAPTNTTPTNVISTVLNDDPNCNLVLKYQNHDIANDGQVHYVNRVLTSDPFDSANPVCVQYNDTRTGEVTVWKDKRSAGRRVDTLPGDRGINKIVVWYE